jgi:hypothetical protein
MLRPIYSRPHSMVRRSSLAHEKRVSEDLSFEIAVNECLGLNATVELCRHADHWTLTNFSVQIPGEVLSLILSGVRPDWKAQAVVGEATRFPELHQHPEWLHHLRPHLPLRELCFTASR